MLKNYWKIALRQLKKQKFYSSVKIGGFALSIAACMLIALFIRDELSYDRQYADADRIYRVVVEYPNGKGTALPPPFAKVLPKEFPEVEKAGRLRPYPVFSGAGGLEVMREGRDKNVYEEGFAFVDQEILDILQLPTVYGDRAHALEEPNTIVITKKKADKYFPGENPVGKVLYLNNDKTKPWKIGGVIKDPPSNTHFQFDFLMTLKGAEFWPGEQQYWLAQNYLTYVKLRPGTDAARLQTKMQAIIKNYIIPGMIQAGRTDAENTDKEMHFSLQSLRDIHLRSTGIYDIYRYGDIRFVWLFGAVASFILLIACINFINLSTAISANRAKEVGLRKVIGSLRSSLIRQFLTESLLYSACSFILAIGLAWLLLPYFNRLAAKSLVFPWTSWWLFPLIVVATVMVGILAGLYPAFYLSSFKPIEVLKGYRANLGLRTRTERGTRGWRGLISRGSRNSSLRSLLVVFQFTTSVILIVATFIVYRQMNFILGKKLGFDKDQVLMIQGTNTLNKEINTFRDELLKLPGVRNATVSGYLPVEGTERNSNAFWHEGKVKQDRPFFGQIWRIDPHYIPTLGMRLMEGRNFSTEMASDSQAVIINQTMAKQLGAGDPIGKRITNSNSVYQVIGVVEDFNFDSMKEDVRGLCMVLGNSHAIVSAKVNTADLAGVIREVGTVWKQFSPNQEIRYTFLDESFARMYEDVRRMGRIFTSFSVLAIIIACLGLFALSAFMAEQRNKEISIRKVLGASVAQLAGLLSGDFLKLVLIAVLIASPIAWWAMNKWLQDFVYRIPFSGWIFFVAGALVLLIALVTISFQTVKAALTNPVSGLRSE